MKVDKNKNKRVVVVSGAFGGMGKATAKLLANNGFLVLALDKFIDETLKNENVIPIKVDISSENSVKEAFEIVKTYASELYAIIHFAGVYMLDSLVEIDSLEFERIFKINLYGAFLINKTFLPLLKDGSKIVITTSELAPLHPLPFTGIYAITKSALDKYAYSLRMELQLKNISVSVLRAGAVATNMLGASTDALERFCEKTQNYAVNADRFRKIVNKVEARKVSADLVAKKMNKILSKKKPKFAYKINRNPLLIMLNILPTKMQFWIIKKILK